MTRLHMLLGPGFDPHRVVRRRRSAKVSRVRNNAAGGRDHGRLVLVDNALEAGTLVAAKSGEPRHLDEIRDARAVILLDQTVELDEGKTELIRKPSSQGRLAGAAKADQRDPPAAVAGVRLTRAGLDQLGDRGKIGRRYAREHVENMRHRRRTPVRPRAGDR